MMFREKINAKRDELMLLHDVNKNLAVFSPWSFDAATDIILDELSKGEGFAETSVDLGDGDELTKMIELSALTAANAKLSACESRLKEAEKVISFYADKNNYTLIDEGRNYHVSYKCYELNKETYGDDELGLLARQYMEKVK
jgi:hypothetical protein